MELPRLQASHLQVLNVPPDSDMNSYLEPIIVEGSQSKDCFQLPLP